MKNLKHRCESTQTHPETTIKVELPFINLSKTHRHQNQWMTKPQIVKRPDRALPYKLERYPIPNTNTYQISKHPPPHIYKTTAHNPNTTSPTPPQLQISIHTHPPYLIPHNIHKQSHTYNITQSQTPHIHTKSSSKKILALNQCRIIVIYEVHTIINRTADTVGDSSHPPYDVVHISKATSRWNIKHILPPCHKNNSGTRSMPSCSSPSSKT